MNGLAETLTWGNSGPRAGSAWGQNRRGETWVEDHLTDGWIFQMRTISGLIDWPASAASAVRVRVRPEHQASDWRDCSYRRTAAGPSGRSKNACGDAISRSALSAVGLCSAGVHAVACVGGPYLLTYLHVRGPIIS